MLVRPIEGERFELVAGGASIQSGEGSGLSIVPVTIREMTSFQARQYALVENLQREDLNPVEETEGLLQLLSVRLGVTREEVISLLNRMSNRKRGLTDNVIRGEEEQAINEVFAAGRASYSRVLSELTVCPCSTCPRTFRQLERGKIEYTKGKVIAQLKDAL
jgi:ParB family chromosome partitioning protein